MIRSFTLCAAVVAAAGLATSAQAAPKKAPQKAGDTVTITGCARPIVPFCTTVSYRGTNYVLHGASPVITTNTYVRVKGRVSGTIGICPGSQMQVISWKKVRGVCK